MQQRPAVGRAIECYVQRDEDRGAGDAPLKWSRRILDRTVCAPV